MLDLTAFWIKFADNICNNLPRKLFGRLDIPPKFKDFYLDYSLFLVGEQLTDAGKKLADFGLLVLRHN